MGITVVFKRELWHCWFGNWNGVQPVDTRVNGTAVLPRVLVWNCWWKVSSVTTRFISKMSVKTRWWWCWF